VFYVAQVFSGCGKPLLGRRRRDTTELEFESLQFERSEDDQSGQNNFVPTLDKLVKDIRQKVQCKIHCFPNIYPSLSGSRVRFLAGAGNFFLPHCVQYSSGSHPAFYAMGIRGSILGGKVSGACS